MNETLLVAVVVSIISPSLLSLITGRQTRKGKRQDWAREDTVAERVQEAAKQAKQAAALLVAAQEETIRRTDAVARAAEERDAAIGVKLDVIHDFVNSDMTSTLESLLIALKTQLILTKRNLVAEPTDDEKAVVAALEIQIGDLETKIGLRRRQQALVDASLSKENGGDH